MINEHVIHNQAASLHFYSHISSDSTSISLNSTLSILSDGEERRGMEVAAAADRETGEKDKRG